MTNSLNKEMNFPIVVKKELEINVYDRNTSKKCNKSKYLVI